MVVSSPLYWNFHRNNIGLVNPNPEPLVITATVLPFRVYNLRQAEIPDRPPEHFFVALAPYGWQQLNWVSKHNYGNDSWGNDIVPDGGFVISLTPDRDDLPYYAYASVVFSPDPQSGNQMFSDPMFVPAEPGYVAPWAEVYPPEKTEE